jgi:hypothetical protein
VVVTAATASVMTSVMVASASMMAVMVTVVVVSIVMMAVPIVVLPFIVKPNSVVEARAYPNDWSSIVVIIIISCFNFDADAYLGDFFRGSGFVAETC